ncbi:DUF3565 domain-containing protein [Alkalilimnicola sp. S0819]|nr:DUF3565 domain-containing protein [Alkalilimnicola sp. S0819]KAB7628474.1 DUF3565 domain-containing protein [Alkalilimnicola sp. S0819]MPQ15225.1 DUF3565 domain-containing protein [Alkalilimnicola sp. S0819]
MKRKILGFHKDDEGHWVADLECGHQQHVRHRPPWINRPWVVSEAGRQRQIGKTLNCKLCSDEMPAGRSGGRAEPGVGRHPGRGGP